MFEETIEYAGSIDGLAGTARVKYHLDAGKPDVKVIEASSDIPVRVLDGPTLLGWCTDNAQSRDLA
ncbi:MAG: hypothetical protein HQ592_12090 [Planctomycetes bacterium]|nr:hypothetical protein [Planctomycetota bacterium]